MKRNRSGGIARLVDQPWALYPPELRRVAALLRGEVVDVELRAGPERDSIVRAGSIAVIPVIGVIEHRSDWLMELFGEGTSVESLRADLTSAINDPDVTAIVLDIDSPGGTVAGIPELAEELREARGIKPIVAVADAFAASAAVWLATQADEFVASPSAQVGSIGVYAMHQDISGMLDMMGVDITLVSAGEFKTEGNEFEPLTDEARADLQSRVDATYHQFVADVAAGRGVPVATVRDDFGKGRLMTPKAAKAAGLIDRIESLGETIQRLTRPVRRSSSQAAAANVSFGLSDDGSVSNVSWAPTIGGTTTTPIIHLPAPEPPVSLRQRVEAWAAEADAIIPLVSERARLRAKEDRPLVSPAIEQALRSSRDAIDSLLTSVEPTSPSPVDPAPSPPAPVDPAPVIKPAAPAPIPARFASRDEFMRFMRAHR